jgi:hypothetical protein
MISISELLFQAFPAHTVSVRHRPDGTLAVTLGEGEQAVSRVIAKEAVSSPQKIQQAIRDIQRDMKIAAGELRASGPDARWVWSALPTYESGPIHVTRAKRLSQRPLSQMGPRRQSVYLSA